MKVGVETRAGAIALVVIVAVSGIATAQVLVFAFDDSLNVQDPIGDNSKDTFSWSNGASGKTKTITSDTPDSTYLLHLELTNYDGQTGTSAVQSAWQGDGNTIQDFLVKNSSKGVWEQVRRDLITDGDAYYYHIPKAPADLTMSVTADSSGTVEIGRGAYIPDEISVRTHRQFDTDKCDTCHAYSKPPHVHQDMGATKYAATDWQSDTCKSCHDNTMTDIHQDCDLACHDDGYPIVAPDGTKHGPNQGGGDMVMGEYFCGPSCHGSTSSWGGDGSSGYGSMGAAHVSALGTDNYCSKCHDAGSGGGGLTNQHTRAGFQLSSYKDGANCAKCHGVQWSGTHHPPKDNMNLGMGTCGYDGCHGSNSWDGGGWG